MFIILNFIQSTQKVFGRGDTIRFAFYLSVMTAVWEEKDWMRRAQVGAIVQLGDNGWPDLGNGKKGVD